MFFKRKKRRIKDNEQFKKLNDISDSHCSQLAQVRNILLGEHKTKPIIDYINYRFSVIDDQYRLSIDALKRGKKIFHDLASAPDKLPDEVEPTQPEAAPNTALTVITEPAQPALPLSPVIAEQLMAVYSKTLSSVIQPAAPPSQAPPDDVEIIMTDIPN